MKLFVIPTTTNFGDQLNLAVFPKLLGPVFDGDRRHLVLGIGTVIGRRAFPGVHEIILGAGAGYDRGRHSLERRTVYLVRGPETARLLGLPERFAGVDPGILVADLFPAEAAADATRPLFMPHWRTDRAAGSRWREACAMAGLDFVSPLADRMAVLERIRQCPLLVTEALHGAVVAESYGKPWIPVVFSPHVLEFKWRDWCASIGTHFRPAGAGPVLHDADAPITARDRLKRATAALGVGKRKWRFIATRRSTNADVENAAAVLSRIVAQAEQYIHRGSHAAIGRGKERLAAAVEEFRRDLNAGRFGPRRQAPAGCAG